jgi:chorismate mutase/prephenate dehydratase
MASEEEQLRSIREEIDALDEQIQELISRRAQCASEVARIKRESNPEVNDFYRPEREAEVLRMVKARNQGPLDDETMVRLFRQIMSDSLALQMPLQVAYLGPEGTYTHAAALKQFGEAINPIPMAAIDEVFREVESGSASYGIVPVENSTEGVINHTLDMFMQSPLNICGEVSLRIHHHLITKAGSLDGIDKIYGHAQALAQCREWLDANLHHVERVAVSSNAEAARIASEFTDAAATASEAAAAIYGLDTLVSNIEDDPNNTTRFIVIGKQSVPPSGNDKTSLLLSTPNRPGALHDMLKPIADNGVSMTRIESRPSRRAAWDYVFFVDVDGHQQDPAVSKVLQELKENTFLVRVLGSYPVSIL